MRLRHPAVQRDNPGQQAKTDYAQQPDVIPQRLAVKHGKVQRAETLPHQPAGQRQQQRAESSERKPQLAGGAASGQEHAAQAMISAITTSAPRLLATTVQTAAAINRLTSRPLALVC